MLHADLQFAILAPHDCIPGVISPLLQSNCRGPHAAPSPFPLSLYSPPAAPSDLPLSCSHLETAEAGALPRQRPRILPRGFWRRPHLRSSPARLDLHPHGGGARAGDGRGGGGRAGRRRRRWWPDPAQAISRSTSEAAQHLRGGAAPPRRSSPPLPRPPPPPLAGPPRRTRPPTSTSRRRREGPGQRTYLAPPLLSGPKPWRRTGRASNSAASSPGLLQRRKKGNPATADQLPAPPGSSPPLGDGGSQLPRPMQDGMGIVCWKLLCLQHGVFLPPFFIETFPA
jgi:hypothetical protein